MQNTRFGRMMTRCVAASFLCLGFAAQALPPVRILPVGDSITLGAGGAGGYRLPLWQMLTNAGYTVDFTGTQTGNGAAALPDSDHEGHSGWRIDQIDALIATVFGTTEDPDALLLMIGTNDFGQNYNVNDATNRLDRLIGKIVTNRPFCKLIVASLTRRGEPYETNIQTNFNNSVPVIVAKYAAEGGQVYFTDMHSAVPLDAANMPDNLHPNTNGYVKMATNWFPAITNVVGPTGTTNAPAMAHVRTTTNVLTNVVITFSKPVSDETATNMANYFLDGGLTILDASLEATNKRKVTLVTTEQTPLTTYTLAVTGVTDRTAAQTVIEPAGTNFLSAGTGTVISTVWSNYGTGPVSSGGVFSNVPGVADYQLVYSVNIPASAAWGSSAVYDVDLRAYASNFSRVAYYLELQTNASLYDFAWVSFDAMTTNAGRIGVPTTSSGATFQQPITNMTVLCTATSVVNGTNFGGGNLEFWPINYAVGNAAGVANASESAFDWGDTMGGGNYGSMQVHHSEASHVIFAFNHWGGGVGAGAVDIGIGNRPGSADLDWTFAGNAAGFLTKRLQVFVLPASYPPPVIAAASLTSPSNVVLTFSMSLHDDATNLANYSIGGLTVAGASLDPATRAQVTLTTIPALPANTIHTAVVNNVHGYSTNSGVIATNSSVTFLGPAANGVMGNVPDATNYALVYSLNIPNAAAYNTAGVPYEVALPQYVGDFTRVAYYMELQTPGGLPNYLWVALDPFTTNANQLGVPAGAASPIFQQIVTNLTVQSSLAGIVQTNGSATGNMEFWPWDYQPANSNAVPGASNTAYDWGDRVISNTGGHGSMQIHNHGAGQTLFAFNNWGAAAGGTTAVGIGNRPGSTDVDWTQAANAGGYSLKRLQVFALPASNVAPVIAGASASSSSNVVLAFSKMLDAASVSLTNFSIPGVTVLGVTLDPVSLARVTLVTTPLFANTTYTSVVNGVKDRTAGALEIAPNSTVVFTTAPFPGAPGYVPEAANYQLVYSIRLAANAAFPVAATYDVDLRGWVTNFSRVAYYLETQAAGGAPAYVWTSFDPVTTNVNRIGIPTASSGAVFQQPITNLNVFCNVTGVVTGTGFAGGNIEFWPTDYSAPNALAVPNASASYFDFGDTRSTGGGYGSMQVHNHDANLGGSTGQVLLAFNRWGGSATTTDLGIGNRPSSNDKDWTFAANAGSFTSRILQVYVLPPTNLTPVVADIAGQPDLSNVVVQFSKQMTDSAAVPTNYAIAGLTIHAVTFDTVSRTRVTLTTSPQAPSTLYPITIGGALFDTSPAQLPLAGGPDYTFMSVARGGALNNVPEAAGWTLVYSLNIPNTANYGATTPAYAVDNHFGVTAYSRIAYYLELVKPGGPTNFIWAAMDPFSQDAGKLGVPVNAGGAYFQQPVTNLSVISSVFGVLNGTNLSGGNLEFWPNTYNFTNSAAVPNASDVRGDWGDNRTAGNYGSMQLHNSAAGQVLFAFNNWGTGGSLDLGIGNNLFNAHPDWTFMNNAGTYTTKVLQVYVLPLPDSTAPTIASAHATADRTRVLVTFSEPLADGADSLANFSIDNDIVISSASLGGNPQQVVLGVSQLAGGASYTLTVNHVRDRSVQANLIAPNSQAVITTAPLPPQILANAPESAGYQLAYALPIPGVATNWNVSGTPYATDNRNAIGPFSRVAYYVELATNAGPTNWVWVSMDAFTGDVNKIAVPDMALAGGPIFQKRVSNLTVLASMTNVVSGTNMSGGNIEFYPFNYAVQNGLSIPGANGGTYDFGDTVSPTFGTSGHAAMQVHNFGATQTVFAMNHWGGASPLDLGIGNQPTGAPDWTNGNNATNYVVKNLYVFVLPYGDTNGPLVARVQNTPDLGRVLVTFNQPLDHDSAAVTNFAIPGLTVNSATLGTNLHDIVLGTSAQTPDTTYTLTISNVRDRTTNSTLMAAPIATNFTVFSPGAIHALIPETTNLTLVYGLTLPAAAPNYNSNGIPYGVDLRPVITQNFNRVAYYLELATNGGATNWVYFSVSAFNTNINRIGIPVLGSGAGFQQKLATNAIVLSSDPGITTGVVNTLSIESYPFNYDATTTTTVTGGSPLHYDWNDNVNVGGQYGSLQVHNWSAGHTLLAFNRWGGGQTGNCDLGMGNAPGTTNTDWRPAQNAANYTTKNLYVFVGLTNAPPPAPPAVVAPVIVTHPASRTNLQNSAAILAGLASGTGPISYQWRKGGTPVGGETNSWLSFASVQLSDAGGYALTASNSAGVATSLVAVLSVTNPPPPAGGYDAWAAQITNGLTNYNDSALGDGYPNLLKYATGSNPTNADGLAHMNGARSNGILALRFNHDTNATDITLVVEGANTVTNNADWRGLATNIGGSWGGATNVAENTATQPASVSVQDTAPSTNRFLRLRVTRP